MVVADMLVAKSLDGSVIAPPALLSSTFIIPNLGTINGINTRLGKELRPVKVTLKFK